jgi:NarL family two-component system response regulator LiaR
MSEPTPIRVMIVDDHLLVRDGLKLLLSTFDDLEVVALAGDGQDAVDLCPQVQPDVVLMDIVMPEVDGPTATKRIRQAYSQVQVIALTSFMEEELIQRAIGAGAIGYLLKNVSAAQLAEAIRAAHQGRSTMDPAAVQILVQSASQPPPLGHDLTNREREVLALLVEGKTNKEIADELTLSPATARGYVSSILSKLGASNRTEAASLALQHNLVSGTKDG